MSKKNNLKFNNKILVILGPTASGKTKLSLKLAKKYNGEIVSADSRQVYIGMDIGTGKDLKEYGKIKYHLIDVADPKINFNLAHYQKLAYYAIDNILSRDKLPIIVGGSGLYLQSIVDGYKLSKTKPNKKLRENLEKLNVQKLYIILKKINPTKFSKLNNSEKNNKRHLIRYIEVARSKYNNEVSVKKYNSLVFGINLSKEILYKRIYTRLISRLEKENMISEVINLRKKGISFKKLINFGLEYKYISLYLKKEISYSEMIEKLFIAIRQFAKRQMSWYRRWEKQGRKIYWLKEKNEAEKLLKNFIKQ